jgi:hypothetical protein
LTAGKYPGTHASGVLDSDSVPLIEAQHAGSVRTQGESSWGFSIMLVYLLSNFGEIVNEGNKKFEIEYLLSQMTTVISGCGCRIGIVRPSYIAQQTMIFGHENLGCYRYHGGLTK